MEALSAGTENLAPTPNAKAPPFEYQSDLAASGMLSFIYHVFKLQAGI
jgi:hypothetical protein